jgi:hypothetical protein
MAASNINLNVMQPSEPDFLEVGHSLRAVSNHLLKKKKKGLEAADLQGHQTSAIEPM